MLQRSTIQLLRFRFSFFLLPVYLFALSFQSRINWPKAALIFFLLHFLLYPASNGYNSYMDRDEESIGGIANPMAPTRQLFGVTIVMDILGTAISVLVSPAFAVMYVVYIVFSRLYSWRGVRLKQYPIIGYLTVILNQGALTFYMGYYGAGPQTNFYVPWIGLAISTSLIGAFYPITQIYQHEQDRKDNVTTISYLLGIRGTFIYCGLLYLTSFSLLAWYYSNAGHMYYFYILQLLFLPVIFLFLRWAVQCWQNKAAANFVNTMRMNIVASTFTNIAFITLILLQQRG